MVSLGSVLLSLSASLHRAKLQRMHISAQTFQVCLSSGGLEMPDQGPGPILPLAGNEGKLTLLMD